MFGRTHHYTDGPQYYCIIHVVQTMVLTARKRDRGSWNVPTRITAIKKQPFLMVLATLALLFLVGSFLGSSSPRNYLSTSTITTATAAKSSYSGIQDWYRDLINKQLQKCSHTSTLMHYFLPHSQCSNPVRYGKCHDGAKWVCLDQFQGRTSKRAKRKEEKCVIYSFGSSNDSCFETAMAENYDCGE